MGCKTVSAPLCRAGAALPRAGEARAAASREHEPRAAGGRCGESCANTPLPGLMSTAPPTSRFRGSDRHAAPTAHINTCTGQKYYHKVNGPEEGRVIIQGNQAQNCQLLILMLVPKQPWLVPPAESPWTPQPNQQASRPSQGGRAQPQETHGVTGRAFRTDSL